MKQYNSTTLVRTIWSLLLALSALCLLPTTAEAQFELVYENPMTGRPTLKGSPEPTGTISFSFQSQKEGQLPYTVKLTQTPTGYTGSTTFKFDKRQDSYYIFGLPAGNYKLEISDASGYKVSRKGLVKETTALQFLPQPFTQEFTSPHHLRWVGALLKRGGHSYYNRDMSSS